MDYFWFIKQSFQLDRNFIKVSRWSVSKKCKFLYVKYYLIIRHFFKPFELGRDYVFLFNRNIYYDSRYGLAGYQRVLATHQKLLSISKVTHVWTCIDIGANVGYVSLLARELFPKAKIYSIEPAPVTYDCLKKNFADDKKSYIFNLAISNKKGSSRMQFDKSNSAISHVDSAGNIKIKTDTLDNFIKEQKIKNVSLLKIDTEGFEQHVLQGGTKTLAKTKYLFIEITNDNNKNYTISSLLHLLYSRQYNFKFLAYRNYLDRGEGEMPIMDALFENINYKE